MNGIRLVLGLVPISLMLGCDSGIPDQNLFLPLDTVLSNSQALVRLYSAPIPELEGIATHPWFIVKRKNANTYSRWEVWQDAGGLYGHVRQNFLTAESGVGAGGTYVIAELQGPVAESVVEFIYTESPTYPCKDNYVLFPGPNSNSYAQWVLTETGWNVTLPDSAIGKDVPCP